MKTFCEFVSDHDYNDVKLMVMNILDPKQTLDQESKSILNMPISDFESYDKLLTLPELTAIINRRPNRAAIIQAIKNDSTTIGNLLSMLTQDEEPEYLG